MWYWLLTSTTYGTWLPGDTRGSVTSVRERRIGESLGRSRVEHDKPGEAWEASIAGLQRTAIANLKSEPVLLDRSQAEVVLMQFRETCAFRKWELLAGSVMANHFHLVIAAADDPDPRKMLNDLKAYGSRALNEKFGQPKSQKKWWTANGSKRKLPDERAVAAAVNYVLHKQPNPLAVYSPSTDASV
jgi:REP element-mobilizing transposase RayT